MRRRPAVGYVLRRFPKISETFILDEILALEARGERIHIFSLMPTRDSRFHAGLGRLKASVDYVPDAFDLKSLLRANLELARRDPRRYLRAFAQMLLKLKPRLLWRFLQGGYIAQRASARRIGHLHAHFANRATTAAMLAAELMDVPYSFTAHAVDIYKNNVSPWELKHKTENARFVVTVSDCNEQFLSSLANGNEQKIVRVYNGIQLDKFRPDGLVPRSPFRIISVARLVEKKGLEHLIDACRILRDRGLEFDCRIVGKGKLRRPLKALIDEHDLGSRVQLLGAKTHDEVLALYRESHAYVLPCQVAKDGNRDGLPVSIVEALACGLPVVSTPVTGIPEVVEHENNGLLVPERDPDALADALERLIVDEALYDRARQRARESVENRFDIQKTSKTMQELYRGAAA
jgi:glycosyltransferase involved in cell wall biosynthesis